MTALQRKLWRDLAQLRGQTLAIALVVVGGVGILVMALSNYLALSATRAHVYAEFHFADVFVHLTRAPLPLLDTIRALPGVRDADARVVGDARLELSGFDEPVDALLISLPDARSGLNRLFLRSGRLPDPARADEVVLGEAFAEAHALHPGDRLVAVLNGRRQTLRVAGIGLSPEYIYQIRAGDVFPDFQRFAVLWMNHRALANAYDFDGAFNDLVIGLRRDARVDDVIDALDRLLARYGSTGAYGRELQQSHRFLDEELKQLAAMTRMFTVVFLGVTAFLVNVVLGRLIGLQREQIAVLKAFGYARWQVAAHYGQMALAMVLAGLPVGIALGSWGGHRLADVYAGFYRFPFLDWRLRPELLLLACAFAASAALLGAGAGLLRTFRLPPAVAMRPEAPPVFRRSLLERLGVPALGAHNGAPLARAMAGLFDPATRMVLRTLERRPWRTLLSVAGIALACGVLVMSRFQSDAIEEMIDLQFTFAQRDDLAVGFRQPSAARAVDELRRLPGVRAVEPFRSVPVVLRLGHREYRTALLGLEPAGDLKRVLGRDLAPAVLPADGLMLTDYLAELLHARAGDVLEVDVLDGRRQQLRVPLAGVVSEYLGVGAYADRRWLNSALGEAGTVSGAWLAIDAGARAEVLAALRARPRVASVGERAAVVQSFRDTMAEAILTFTLVATLLAGSIAVGVVYNAARIALSERSRELASLRVLGYTKQEVRGLLAGELLTLTLLALPPSVLFGYGLSALLAHGFESELYRVPLVLHASGFAFAGLLVLAATVVSIHLVRRRLDALDLVAVLKSKE